MVLLTDVSVFTLKGLRYFDPNIKYYWHCAIYCRAPPVQDFTYGQLRIGGMCLDSVSGFANQPVEMRPCSSEPRIEQVQ